MTDVRVTKHASDGRKPYSYDAKLVERSSDWIVVEAEWPLHEVNAGPVSFKPGDRLVEFFSITDHFNAFLIYRNRSSFAGWYCNVTHPTTVEGNEIHWHDLYLDVLVDADGGVHIEDEDELDESGLAVSDPDLYATILATKERILRLIERNEYPFSTVG
ncbi:MAG: DUF402 domain-containing protein [Thermomicrobiales bacterium]